MPNWCENKLLVRGLPEELQCFAAENKGVVESDAEPGENVECPLSFAKIAPIPEGYYEDGRWHEWCCQHWGTKWDLDEETRVKSNLGELAFRFETRWFVYDFLSAWSPPVPWLAAVATKHPKLTFALKYKDEAMDFAGVAFCQDGALVSDEELEVEQY